MKTPEQIAQASIASFTALYNAESIREVRAAIIGAIEADRAQRTSLTADGTERFYGMDLEEGVHDFPFGPETHGIVDEEEGGIIAYCHAVNTPRIVRALRDKEV